MWAGKHCPQPCLHQHCNYSCQVLKMHVMQLYMLSRYSQHLLCHINKGLQTFTWKRLTLIFIDKENVAE